MKAILFFLILFSSTVCFSQINSNDSIKLKAFTDADLYHTGQGLHIILGSLFGGISIIGVAFTNPKIYPGLLTDPSRKKIISDPIYISAYKKKSKRNTLIECSIGCCISTMISLYAIQKIR